MTRTMMATTTTTTDGDAYKWRVLTFSRLDGCLKHVEWASLPAPLTDFVAIILGIVVLVVLVVLLFVFLVFIIILGLWIRRTVFGGK